MSRRTLRLALAAGRYAVCRLPPDAAVDPALVAAPFASVTRTGQELSIVCREEAVPDGARCQRGWKCLTVAGPFAFTETGILASLASPLAAAGVPIFAISTFDTDHLLVPADHLAAAIAALRSAGHEVREDAALDL